MYEATLTLCGILIMSRKGNTPDEAIEALGGVSGPGYRIEVERVGVLV